MSDLGKRLFDAAKRGDLPAIRDAVAAGAPIDDPATAGFHPAIVVAAEAGQLMAIELLLELGARADAEGSHHFSALGKAIQSNRAAIVELLTALPCYQTPLAQRRAFKEAVQYGKPKFIDLFLARYDIALNAPLFAPGEKGPYSQSNYSDTPTAGWTALHYAADFQKTESARALLRAGADPDVRDNLGRTPLHCTHWNSELAASLIAWGADRNATDQRGRVAAILGPRDLAGVEAALAAAQRWVEQTRSKGAAPKRKPAASKSAALKPAAGDSTAGDPAAGDSASADSIAGDSVASKQPAADPGLSASEVRGESSSGTDVARAQMQLEEAARAGDVAGIRAALEAGLDPAGRIARGRTTALHLAVENNHRTAVEYLLQLTGDPNLTDSLGKSLLFKACEKGRTEVAQLLIAAGADLHLTDRRKWTPLHAACHHGRSAMVELLLASGSDPNAVDEHGTVPYQSAIGYGGLSNAQRFRILLLLLDHGADPNVRTGHGMSFTDYLQWLEPGQKQHQLLAAALKRARKRKRDSRAGADPDDQANPE